MMVLFCLIIPHSYSRKKDNSPCLEIATILSEDKYHKLPGCDDTLIHESFLSSHIYTIDDKYALCKKYMHGLKLPYGTFFKDQGGRN
jgi:tRNA nucleotidyltransferase (CCA-adding enzyme)